MVRNFIFLALVALAVTIYALIECVRARPNDVRSLPKMAWVAVIILLPLLGAGLWFWLGRPPASAYGNPKKKRVPQPVLRTMIRSSFETSKCSDARRRARRNCAARKPNFRHVNAKPRRPGTRATKAATPPRTPLGTLHSFIHLDQAQPRGWVGQLSSDPPSPLGLIALDVNDLV